MKDKCDILSCISLCYIYRTSITQTVLSFVHNKQITNCITTTKTEVRALFLRANYYICIKTTHAENNNTFETNINLTLKQKKKQQQ